MTHSKSKQQNRLKGQHAGNNGDSMEKPLGDYVLTLPEQLSCNYKQPTFGHKAKLSYITYLACGFCHNRW